MRVALVLDLAEEGWTSMDYVGEMTARALTARGVDATVVCPPAARLTRRLPTLAASRAALRADRIVYRVALYPAYLRRIASRYTVFHIIDHSYAHLVHSIPAHRTVVTCHDLDAFRSVRNPPLERRSAPFRLFTRRILSGFRKAAHIACVTRATENELRLARLNPSGRVTVIPNGVDPAFNAAPNALADAQAAALLGPIDPKRPEILHVGQVDARKRIDIVLHAFAALLRRFPTARLIRAGGRFTPVQRALAQSLGILAAITELPFLDRPALAAVYRRATLCIFPSDREGFGLPVAESLASATPVLASDLEALREVGGSAARYCLPGDTKGWGQAIIDALNQRAANPQAWEDLRRLGQEQAARFTWDAYAARMIDIYQELQRG